jgi:hypothetical protein
MSRFASWFEQLNAAGVLKGGQPLLDEARVVSVGTDALSDGPFAESKEAIGGYFLVKADSLEEAVSIAQQCPTLEYGGAIEVRPVAAECPTFQRARELASQELATATA